MIEWIKNLRSTDRGKAAFKLLLYAIFLAFVILIILLGNSPSSKTTSKNSTELKESTFKLDESLESTETLTYLEKQSRLYTDDYDFTYTITGKIEAIFEGEYKDGRVDGLKETEDMLIHYSIENNIIYKHSLKDRQEYTELYKDLDSNLFDFKKLFQTLNQATSTIDRTSMNKIYNYKEVGEYTITLTTNQTEITSILIKSAELEYNFEFKYKERRS